MPQHGKLDPGRMTDEALWKMAERNLQTAEMYLRSAEPRELTTARLQMAITCFYELKSRYRQGCLSMPGV